MSSKKYDEDDYEKRNREILKRLGLVILVVVTIILLFFLLKGCVNNNTKNKNKNLPVVNKDLSTILLEAGKEYYKSNSHYLPRYGGECNSVNSLTLSQQGLIDKAKFTSCDNESTYVKVCKLSNGKYHYVPFLYCQDNITEKKYSTWMEGQESSVVADQTDVKFLFQVEFLEDASSVLGPIESIWENEISYNNYKIVDSTKYYRYRDLQYIWNVKTTNYYPSNVSDASKVNEYYVTSPAANYTNKSNQNNSVAKYFSTTQEKIYWVDANGNKKLALSAPDNEYIYKDNPIYDTRYRTRTWTETSKPVSASPLELWICKSPTAATQYISDLPCETQTVNPNYTITINHIYSCDGGLTDVGVNGVCYRCTDGQGLKVTRDSCGYYGSWGSYTKTICDTTQTDVCESKTLTAYYWYKLGPGEKTYYPSGSKTASGEKTYYAEAPTNNLIRDEATVTTGWKWYKSTESQTATYYATAPVLGATKTSKSRWTEFSSWSTTKPESLSPNGTREIQIKTKLDIRKITPSGNSEWKIFNSEYLTLDELIKQLQAKGYNINSLEDIMLSGELKYKTKLLIRNKEVK